MTTLSDVIERTRARLMTSHREPVNALAAGVDASETAWTFSYDTKFTDGGRLSIGLETVRVVGAAALNACNVIRGVGGSVAATHASGTVVRVNPTWTNFEISQAINDELADLSSPRNSLFQVRSVDFDFQPSRAGYELVGLLDFIDVWRVRYDTPGPEHAWPVIRPSEWRVDQAADTADFPSGVQLVLDTGGSPGQKVRVSYRASFTRLPTLVDADLAADILTATGLHAEAHDILSLGAAIRLLSGLEAQRAYMTTQANPRRADEVPPRTAVSAIAPLAQQREDRINAEAIRLRARYPKALT